MKSINRPDFFLAELIGGCFEGNDMVKELIVFNAGIILGRGGFPHPAGKEAGRRFRFCRQSFQTVFLLVVVGFFGCAPRGGTPEGREQKEEETREKSGGEVPPEIDPTILAGRLFKEAPSLAEAVERGALPPLTERLPEHPMVIRPLARIGKYGGTIHRAITGDISGRGEIRRTFNENLMKFERPVAHGIALNLAEHYEFLEGGRTAIFKLRKGVRWSDGVPFTVDDILFWYYDVAFDEQARDAPFGPSEWVLDDKPIKLEKVDDLTLKVSSPEPLGRVLFALCHENLAIPKHYFARHHPKYNPRANYKDFRKRITPAQLTMNPGTPTLGAWRAVQWTHGQRIEYERNPYYWKVDTAGNQLPYVDRLIFTVIPDTEVILLKFINGEIDLLADNARISMAQILHSEEAKGTYELRVAPPNTGPVFFLNWDAEKAALREAFREKAVRIALSVAINREEIKAIVFHGLLTPLGFSFFPNNPYFSAASAHRYIEYDPEKASSMLDHAGYRDRDGGGFRKLKDGSRFEVTIDVDLESGYADVCELVADYWKAIGIKAFLFVASDEIIYERRLNGKFEIHVNQLDGAAEPLDVPHQWGIWKPNTPFWHRKAAMEGPEWLREVSRLLREAMITINQEERRATMVRIRELHSENIPAIAIGATSMVWGANRRLGNVPYEITTDNAYRAWSHPLFFEQIYVK